MNRKKLNYLKNKKIIYIHKSWQNWGGAQQNVFDLINHFKNEFGKTIFICNDCLLFERMATLKIKMYKLPIASKKTMPLALIYLAKILLKEKPDIVHSNHRYGTLLVQLLRYVLPIQYNILHTARSVFRTKTWCRFLGDKIIANSKAVEKNLLERFSKAPEKIDIIYDGVELSMKNHLLLNQPNDPVYQMLDTCQKTIIGCIGNLVEAKGHQYLLEALKQLSPQTQDKVLVLIVGDGPLRKKLEAHARKLHVTKTVKFLGYRDDACHILSYCNFTVIPSVQEGLPNVLIESYLLGKPAIVSELDYANEILKPHNIALTFPVRNTEKLTGALQHYVEHPKLAARHGSKGKKIFKTHFSLKQNLANYQQAYIDLLELNDRESLTV